MPVRYESPSHPAQPRGRLCSRRPDPEGPARERASLGQFHALLGLLLRRAFLRRQLFRPGLPCRPPAVRPLHRPDLLGVPVSHHLRGTGRGGHLQRPVDGCDRHRRRTAAEPDGRTGGDHARRSRQKRPKAEASRRSHPAPSADDEFSFPHGAGFAASLLLIMFSEQVFLNAGPLVIRGIEGVAAAGYIFNVLMIARAPLQLFQAVSTSILPHLTSLHSASGDADSGEFHQIANGPDGNRRIYRDLRRRHGASPGRR